MAGESVTASYETVGNGLQKLIVSMVYFSGACALFGVERLESAVSSQEGGGLSRAVEDTESTLNSMAESLSKRMGQSNRDTMNSAAGIAEQIIELSFGSLSVIDPRRVVNVALNLVQKSTEVISALPAGDQPAVEDKNHDEPQLAVEVLTATD